MENKKLINKAISFIQKKPKENLSLQSIADNAGFSLNYFDMMFRRHTGYSPVEYSRVYKLTRSALELRRTEKTVLDIALDFGYSSPESFTRAFKNFYSITPSEYRERYSNKAVTWHDLSGKIAIERFKRSFPELKVSDTESALDFFFTHNPSKYAEDMIGITIAETAILTLGDPETPEHFLYVSDYNSADPFVMLVSENESDAIPYLNLLTKNESLNFHLRKSIDAEWETFDREIAKLGWSCRYGYDMIYPFDSVKLPEYNGMTTRELTADDLPQIEIFKQNGGCSECHLGAIKISFSKKGNIGLRPIGLFIDGEMSALAMPSLDTVRDFRQYDIGAVFATGKAKDDRAIELIWKYAIDMCLKDNAVIGNANAKEDPNSPLGVETCERIGLVKVAKSCVYSK